MEERWRQSKVLRYSFPRALAMIPHTITSLCVNLWADIVLPFSLQFPPSDRCLFVSLGLVELQREVISVLRGEKER